MNPDLINGLFEFGGFWAVFLSIKKVLKDKQVRGISWAMLLFFTSWGVWNLFYYPHLGQHWSTIAAAMLCGANIVYTSLLVHFTLKEGRNS